MDLEELYDKLYRYCYMKTRHPQTAEDLTQEVFLRFLRTRDVSEIKKQTAYLYTIARNLCIDFYRTKQALPLEQAEDCAAVRAGYDRGNDCFVVSSTLVAAG